MTADYPLILVCWLDSARPMSAWVALEDLEQDWLAPCECQSVGWQLPSADDVIALAPNLGDVDSDAETALPQACGIIRIPRRAVTSITTLQPSTRRDRSSAEIRKLVTSSSGHSSEPHVCGDYCPHTSDCAVHRAPALPVGPCTCGALPDQCDITRKPA